MVSNKPDTSSESIRQAKRELWGCLAFIIGSVCLLLFLSGLLVWLWVPKVISFIAAVNSRPPEGFHDGYSGRADQPNCVAFGWAVDPDNRAEDLNVRVLLDGDVAAQTIADAYRPDLNVPNGCPGGSCGFLVPLWNLTSHNEQHSILVQAQDLQTEQWKDLSSTPKTLNCGY